MSAVHFCFPTALSSPRAPVTTSAHLHPDVQPPRCIVEFDSAGAPCPFSGHVCSHPCTALSLSLARPLLLVAGRPSSSRPLLQVAAGPLRCRTGLSRAQRIRMTATRCAWVVFSCRARGCTGSFARHKGRLVLVQGPWRHWQRLGSHKKCARWPQHIRGSPLRVSRARRQCRSVPIPFRAFRLVDQVVVLCRWLFT